MTDSLRRQGLRRQGLRRQGLRRQGLRRQGLRRQSVRRQLMVVFVLFALALGGLFGVVTLLVFHRVEDRMIERRLEQMLKTQPAAQRPASVDFVGPLVAAPPPFRDRLDGLGPGLHEWEAEGRETHALVLVDPHSGQRTVALASFVESTVSETRLELALVVGIAMSMAVALVLARFLAVRIVSPIEHLTKQLAAGALSVGGVSSSIGLVDAGSVERAELGGVSDDLTCGLRDDEIGTLAQALRRASLDLAASAERERRFLREASHELRTPITVIQGVSDLLHESMDVEDRITRQRLERLRRSLRRMNTSVLSLLAIARAEHRLTVTDMPPFDQQLEDLVEEARGLALPGVEVSTEIKAAPSSELAASMLIVVLSNLTRNAVQHTVSGKVHVLIETARAQVLDTGPGLPASLLDQLGSIGPQPDIGIGLATVQRICQRFGWSFTLECPAEGGTVATVDLQPPDVEQLQPSR